jgi:hypothetical protein
MRICQMTNFNAFDHEKFVQVSRKTLERIRHYFGHLSAMQGRDGAYFSACDEDGVPVNTICVGPVRREKRSKYKFFSEEKGERLALLNKFAGHTLSRESVDEEVERYIGGIRVANGGYQISGFPADIDECGSLAVAYAMGDLHVTAISHMLRSNPYYSAGLDLVRDVGHAFDVGK